MTIKMGLPAMARRQFLCMSAGVLLLPACRTKDADMAAQPVEIDPQTTCSLDGMLLADYPGPKAQIHYQGERQPVFFCDTVELFDALMRPERVRPVKAAFVQDMGQQRWESPKGKWIDAKSAFFVHGSRQRGSMGLTIIGFSTSADAGDFVKAWGGKVWQFAEITPEMVDLCGGSRHDQRM